MKTIVVGGTWGQNPKQSGIAVKLASALSAKLFNGQGQSEALPSLLDEEADLAVWMPDIDNNEEKYYPSKPNGCVLICSKVMRTGYTKIDAVSRIFAMHGNASILIYPIGVEHTFHCIDQDIKPDQEHIALASHNNYASCSCGAFYKCLKSKNKYSFELVDALSNTWYKGSSISDLAAKILEFYAFTKSSIRIGCIRAPQADVCLPHSQEEINLRDILAQNNRLSGAIMKQCGNRFFGNISTRCQSLFPSLRVSAEKNAAFISPRNVDKNGLTPRSMLLCSYNQELNRVVYFNGYGDQKPSIDAPVQLRLYAAMPKINYMIHGHAFLKEKEFSFPHWKTDEYYLCGDIREADSVLKKISDIDSPNYGVVNLKNHGFLIFSDSLENVETIIDQAKWEMTYDKV